MVLHYKVLSRLIDDQGQSIPAGRFLPWLERFGWTARLDRLMLEQVLEQMAGHRSVAGAEPVIGDTGRSTGAE